MFDSFVNFFYFQTILGLNGLNGMEPPDITDVDQLTKLGFHHIPGWESSGSTYIESFYFYGFMGTRATDGGHGGCGGLGGYKGKSLIFGFENATNFDVFSENGMFQSSSFHLNSMSINAGIPCLNMKLPF